MDQLQPGDPQQVGQYRISARLGVGGMGKVFLGKSPGGRLVAVKVVHREHAADEAFRARFRREVIAMRSVSGVFTAPVIDADVDCAEPWLATAYVPGPSLAEALTKAGPLPPASVLVLASGLGEALAAIHGVGLAHRDLKPSNVLLADDGPKVIDFGLAVTRQASALTQAGTVMGTIGYMSPEQVEGRQVGPSSDIFSYGVLMVHAATGKLPFAGESTGAVLYAILNNEPDLVGVDSTLLGIVTACLKKEPEDRPTAMQLMSMLSERAVDTAVPKGGWLPSGVTQLAAVIPPSMPPQGSDGFGSGSGSADRIGTMRVPRSSSAPDLMSQDTRNPYAPPPQTQAPVSAGPGYGSGGQQYGGQQYGSPQNPYAVPTTPPGMPQQQGYQTPQYAPVPPPGYGAPGYGAPGYGVAPGGYYGAPYAPVPRLAHWGLRVGAFLLDMLIASVPNGIFTAIAVHGIHHESDTSYYYGDTEQWTHYTVLFGVMMLLIPLYYIAIGIFQLALQGRTGASIGKHIVGIRLVSVKTMRPIGFWACLGRQFCHVVDSLAAGTGWLAPLWTQRKQTYADMMMDTVVVKAP